MSPSVRPAVYIHVGAPKTGTTYLQQILHHNRPALRRAGLLYPGTQHAHFWASQDLRERRFRGHTDAHVAGAWKRLVKEIRGWPDRSLIDHETLAAAPREAIDRAFADLDFAEVHIVLTARDLARQLPATWQERVKNGSTGSYSDFLASVRAAKAEREPAARHFWAMQGAPAILARWSRTLPPEHVHVVTVPPRGSDPGLLWQRFAGLLGVDPGAYDTALPVVNTSLGAAEAAVLRRFNAAIGDLDLPWPAYAGVFKQRLAPALAERAGKPIEVPEDDFHWAVERGQKMADDLRAAGYAVVGDLADLVPASRPTGVHPDHVPAEASADAALAGMVSMVTLVAESRVATTAVRRSQRGAFARRVEDIVGRTPALRRLRDAYRRRSA
ncbi:MAG: hypothetical protein QOI15_2349 [Pseudonocardiales bacterium]|nr:hypothetical protein [Pseudonocardiales bacterium]